MKNRYLYVVKRASRRMKNQRIAAAYGAWVAMVEDKQHQRLLLKRAAAKISNRTISAAFDSGIRTWKASNYEESK